MIFDPAAWLLDMHGFGGEGRTGFQYLGQFLGMDKRLKVNGWVSKETGVMDIRYSHWKRPILKSEVIA